MQTFDGLELHVRTYGRADAPVTVVLAHCWTADTEDWHYQVRDLLAEFGHDVQVVTWDHRGHGRSDHAPLEACTVANLATDMAQVIDTHAPHGELVLAGHSIGGMTMMALAEQRPDLVARAAGALFVATSAADLHTVNLGLPELGAHAKARIPWLLAQRARVMSRSSRRRMPAIERSVVRQLLFGDDLRLRDTGLVVDQLINCPPATMEGFLRDMLHHHDRVAALSAYDDVPTIVLVGTKDRLTPPSHARRIAASVRGARLVVLPGAGHMLPLERDTAVTAALVELVRRPMARAGRAGLAAAPQEARNEEPAVASR